MLKKSFIRLKLIYVSILLVIGNRNIYASTLMYRATFEQGFISEGLKIKKELQYGGSIDVVDNPDKSGLNKSNRVARCMVPPIVANAPKVRAEITSDRSPTNERVRTYNFSLYIPSEFYNKGRFSWLIFSQFKTWPCGYHDGHNETICDACGIFNDIVHTTNGLSFRLRAKPDCRELKVELLPDAWHKLTIQIYWTKTSNGWAKVFCNGALFHSINNIRTLFTTFDSSKCNMYWAVGVYCKNTGDTASLYVDNLEIYEGAVEPDIVEIVASEHINQNPYTSFYREAPISPTSSATKRYVVNTKGQVLHSLERSFQDNIYRPITSVSKITKGVYFIVIEKKPKGHSTKLIKLLTY